MKNETHMMIDLETLDLKESAVILSAGIAVFSKDAILDDKYLVFDVDEQLKRGRTISFPTLCWWMNQEDGAKRDIFSEGYARDYLGQLMISIARMQERFSCTRLWAHGPVFDIGKLEHVSNQYAIDMAWKYNSVRDTRTLYDCFPNMVWPDRSGTAHNALDDARYQAHCVMNCFNQMKGYTHD